MKRDLDLEATIVEKYVAVAPVLDERSRRRWAAAESMAIGYGGDALVSSATGLARETIRKGRREIARGATPTGRIRAPGAGRPGIEQDQPGIMAALDALVDPLTRGDPTSPLRWTCKSRAKLTAALTEQGWRVSSTTVGRLLHCLGYRLQSVRKRRRVQGRHVLQTSDALGAAGAQLGPGVVALVVELHTEMGVPLAKVAHVLRTTFGLQVTPGGLAHLLHRTARDAAPTYTALCEQVRNSPVVTPDETGWRVGGLRHWLWAWVTPETTVYAICPGRGFDDAATVCRNPSRRSTSTGCPISVNGTE